MSFSPLGNCCLGSSLTVRFGAGSVNGQVERLSEGFNGVEWTLLFSIFREKLLVSYDTQIVASFQPLIRGRDCCSSPDSGCSAMIYPISYIEVVLKTFTRHCARSLPSELRTSPLFSPWRIK